MAQLLVQDEPVLVFLKLIYWGFNTKQSLEFTQNIVKNKKHPERGSSGDRKTLLMWKVRVEWPDWLEMTERQQ